MTKMKKLWCVVLVLTAVLVMAHCKKVCFFFNFISAHIIITKHCWLSEIYFNVKCLVKSPELLSTK